MTDDKSPLRIRTCDNKIVDVEYPLIQYFYVLELSYENMTGDDEFPLQIASGSERTLCCALAWARKLYALESEKKPDSYIERELDEWCKNIFDSDRNIRKAKEEIEDEIKKINNQLSTEEIRRDVSKVENMIDNVQKRLKSPDFANYHIWLSRTRSQLSMYHNLCEFFQSVDSSMEIYIDTEAEKEEFLNMSIPHNLTLLSDFLDSLKLMNLLSRQVAYIANDFDSPTKLGEYLNIENDWTEEEYAKVKAELRWFTQKCE